MTKRTTSLSACAALILLGVGVTSLANAAYIFTDLGTMVWSSSVAYTTNNASPVASVSSSDLLLDSWVEVILSSGEQTGIAFYYDTPFNINNIGHVYCNQLWVRIYPDDIYVDTHEQSLTDLEVLEATGFFSAQFKNLTDADKLSRPLFESMGAGMELPITPTTSTGLPILNEFIGMPHTRWWSFESGSVNFGSLEGKGHILFNGRYIDISFYDTSQKRPRRVIQRFMSNPKRGLRLPFCFLE